MTSLPDELETAIAALHAGDEGALARLFSIYRNQLRRMIAFRMDQRLKGRIDTSDVMQEAYVEAAKRIHHFQEDPAVPFIVWLRQIAAQTLIDLHRHHLGTQKRDANREVSTRKLTPPRASSIYMADQFVGDLTSPSHAAQRTEMMDKVKEVLETMNKIDREVLTLRHFEELSNKDTADILGIEQAAASVRYIRALKRLKDALGQVCPDLSFT